MTFATAGAAARRARLPLAAALLAICVACSSVPPAPPASGIDPLLMQFLPDPAPLAGSSLSVEVAQLHRRLLAGEDPHSVTRGASALLQGSTNDLGVRLLLAEAHLVSGEAAAAASDLASLPAEASRLPEVALVAGRAAETLDDLVAAASWYRIAANAGSTTASGSVAERRLREIEPRAVEILGRRGGDLLARGRVDEAERVLIQLEALRATERATLELSLQVARTKGDTLRELAALRALAPASPETLELQLRRGELEVEIGDARAGLDLLNGLAAKHPRDLHVADSVERSKLVFRLANAPDAVRSSAGRAQLTRADFARLLYWLLPEIRTARGGTARIASDILDHPAREEIVRVVSHGLLRIDEVRHLFEPERPVRRGEALYALLADPATGGRRPCAAAAGADSCAGALACGLLAEAGECFPSAPLSGREAVDWIRRVPDSSESEP